MRDRRGVEGIPLRLLVTAAVLALTLPPVAQGLLAHDQNRTEDRLRGEIVRVLTLAGRLALAGGGRAHLTADFRGGAFTAVDTIVLRTVAGTGIGEFTLVGLPPRTVTAEGTPGLLFPGPQFLLGPGIHELTLEYDRVAGQVRVAG